MHRKAKTKISGEQIAYPYHDSGLTTRSAARGAHQTVWLSAKKRDRKSSGENGASSDGMACLAALIAGAGGGISVSMKKKALKQHRGISFAEKSVSA
jgi:hypothetical protein